VDNLWFIDWTHADDNPVELDFAKLENDVKFVMSKEFEANDLPRLRQFEEYLLNSRLPAEAELLPASLKFVKWDLRYRKILNCVIQIRRACFDLKQDSNGWLIYQIALLKYAMHTLSFDKRRERGECSVIQLLHALFSVETLVFQLIADDFHLRIRGERPSSYPARHRISIDQAPWLLDSPEYSPAHYVAPEVLNNELKEDGSGWAHPEDFASAAPQVIAGKSRHVDDAGRPLNPRGRTGLSGRGMLGRWGANPAVAVMVTRRSTDGENLELLVGRRENQLGLSLPRGFLFPLESAEDAFERILAEEVNIKLSVAGAEMLIDDYYDDYYYDPRQTDHAWVEVQAYVVRPDVELVTEATGITDAFDEIDWWPLKADTINELSSSGARLVRAAITHLQDNGTIDPEYAARVLSRTG
jgi:ADP-ribose pyrophosphatase